MTLVNSECHAGQTDQELKAESKMTAARMQWQDPYSFSESISGSTSSEFLCGNWCGPWVVVLVALCRRSDFLDMVFLDGDHRYETVAADIKVEFGASQSSPVSLLTDCFKERFFISFIYFHLSVFHDFFHVLLLFFHVFLMFLHIFSCSFGAVDPLHRLGGRNSAAEVSWQVTTSR